MKRLVVLSNHPPTNWSEEMKKGWDEIIYIPHPHIPPDMSREELEKLAQVYVEELFSYNDSCLDTYFTIQGEYLFTLLVTLGLLERGVELDKFIYPTTQRVSKEELQSDGSIKKVQFFKFVQWR